MWTRRFPLNYSKEERIKLGKEICESGMSNLQAANKYGICEESARRYRLAYEESVGIVHITDKSHKSVIPSEVFIKEDYESMSKKELIQELMKSKINEARLKKGYMVKGDGANKEFFLIDNKNTK